MEKAFTNFTWINAPSRETPISAENLNSINNGLDTVDDRVIAFNNIFNLSWEFTLLSSGWTLSGGVYSNTVELEGMLEDMVVIAWLSDSANDAQIKAYGLITGFDSADGSLTFHAYSAPTVDIPMSAKYHENALPEQVGAPNPNLIDNPFFRINSRGQNSWTASQAYRGNYCADRWGFVAADPNIGHPTERIGNAIKITPNPSSSVNAYIRQIVETSVAESLVGKVVTLSVHVDANTLVNGFQLRYGNHYSEHPVITGTGIFSITFTVESANDIKEIYLHGADKSTETGYVQVSAVKLELGSVSTLANDIPEPDIIEKQKCMSSTADSRDTYANKNMLSGLSYTIVSTWT